MRQKLFFSFLQTILVGALLIGLLLVWASFQSFETLSSLFNRLASDGELESFNRSLYRTLKLPFAVTRYGPGSHHRVYADTMGKNEIMDTDVSRPGETLFLDAWY
jgi:hypothetical protein